jgi:hypothetical protein
VALVGIFFSFSAAVCYDGFEADGLNEFIKISDGAMVEAVELRSLVIMDSCIGADGAEKASGQRRINRFEQLRKTTERVSVGEKLISAGIWKLVRALAQQGSMGIA